MADATSRASRIFHWGAAYSFLVFLSFIVQLFIPNVPKRLTGDSAVELGRQHAEGPSSYPPVEVVYRDIGEDEAILLLHGSPGSKEDFRHLQPMLAEHFRSVAVDLPGFGASEKSIPDYSNRAHARYVLSLMDQLGLHRAHVFGYSMGSGVALQMADIAPERIRTITMYAGIGIQEGEGSGDYTFEHLKYALGYGMLVAAPELIPHFGLLGTHANRRAFIRNFWDSDQRPLRGVLERLRVPLLVLHGRHDPLVHHWVAEEHHRIVPHSTLVMFDASHFMLLSESGSRQIADWLIPFLSDHGSSEAAAVRTTVDLSQPTEKAALPIDLEISRTSGPWLQIAALAAASFVSEDLTCITAGLLIRQAGLDAFVAIAGCTLGIFLGDILLWLLGRLAGRRILAWGPIARRMPIARVERYTNWIERHAAKLVLASRFMPGTRVPMYITAGILGRSSLRFLLWLLVAAILWTPLLVIASAVIGPALVRPLERVFGHGWIAFGAGAVVVLILLRLGELTWSEIGRARIMATVSRLWRWEFWPMWLFYLPLAPWLLYLAVRYRGLMTPTAANPAIPSGGVVGESKLAILRLFPQIWVVPTAVIPPGRLDERLNEFDGIVSARGWTFPLILKPDVGQRGRGLKLCSSREQAARYFNAETGSVLVQAYHPGPYEAGVFYYRIPGEATGRIFSITDKQFPEAIGDGVSTIEQLIWRHQRLRMQARTFLSRHAAQLDRVPAAGERVRLAVAGNHCQGTLFCDGARLITPSLERRIDEIARAAPGFFFGRFDMRYTDPDAFMQGHDLAIVEFNGVSSESTNIYDPAWPIWRAYWVLMCQWQIAFRIGAMNRRAGVATTRLGDVVRETMNHFRTRSPQALSD